MNWIIWLIIVLIILFLLYYWWRDRQQKEEAARRAEDQARQSAARKAALGTAAGAGVGAAVAAAADAKGAAARTGADLADGAADAAGGSYAAGRDAAKAVRSAVDDAGDAVDDLKGRAADLLGGGADLGRDAARDVRHDAADAAHDVRHDAADAAHGIRHGAADAARDAGRAGDDLIGGAAGVWSEATRPADAAADELRERAADLGAGGDAHGASHILDDLEQRAKHARADAGEKVDDLLGAHRGGDAVAARAAGGSALEPLSEVEERQGILADAASALSATEAQRHMTDAGEAIAGFTPHVGDVPRGAVVGTGDHDCPASHPVKGNEPSMIYHQPGDNWYERTIPELCFRNAADAEAAGFRAARHGGGGHGHAADAGSAAAGIAAPEVVEEVVGEPYTGEVPPGARAGDGRRSCPASHPVKGNASSMIYHEPGTSLYERTIPELCFRDAADAEAAGFRAPRHGGGHAAASEAEASDAARGIAAAAVAEHFHEPEPYTGEVPNGAVVGDGGRACPSGFAVKGNVPSMIYHLPGQQFYSRTIPELCFRSARDAAKAGFRPIRTHSADEPVLIVESEAMGDDAAAAIAGRGARSRLGGLAAALAGIREGGESDGGSARGLTGRSFTDLVGDDDLLRESAGVRRCPATHPIKGNLDSGLYHVPGGASYNQTIAEFCFTTREAAETAGFDAAKR